MTKFILLTLPRTGSTLLSKSLNKHPEIFSDDEIFHFSFKKKFNTNQFKFFKLSFLSKKINYIINYPLTFLRLKNFLDDFYTNKPNENFKARGFKLMYYQTLYVPGLFSYLKKNDIKIILLVRENIFRNALSYMRAKSTGIYHQDINIEKISVLPEITIDITSLKNKMEHIIYQNNKLGNIVGNLDNLKIKYEDFIDWNNTLNKISDFLNVSKQEIPPGVKKLNPENPEESITNFNEVRNWLQKSRYKKFAN